MAQAKRKQKDGTVGKAHPSAVETVAKPGDDRAALIAQTYLRPTVQAAATVRAFNAGKDSEGPELMALVAELGKQNLAVNGGDMRRAEAMLLGQAHSLDAIFGSLARRAVNQEYLRQYETYMRLALKAQSQCRSTLDALANIKNPRPLAFVQQANIAHGPQQVNNRTAAPAAPIASAPADARRPTETLRSEPNELLECTHGERMDVGTETTAIAPNQGLEAVGKVYRPQDRSRQRGREQERE